MKSWYVSKEKTAQDVKSCDTSLKKNGIVQPIQYHQFFDVSKASFEQEASLITFALYASNEFLRKVQRAYPTGFIFSNTEI